VLFQSGRVQCLTCHRVIIKNALRLTCILAVFALVFNLSTLTPAPPETNWTTRCNFRLIIMWMTRRVTDYPFQITPDTAETLQDLLAQAPSQDAPQVILDAWGRRVRAIS